MVQRRKYHNFFVRKLDGIHTQLSPVLCGEKRELIVKAPLSLQFAKPLDKRGRSSDLAWHAVPRCPARSVAGTAAQTTGR